MKPVYTLTLFLLLALNACAGPVQPTVSSTPASALLRPAAGKAAITGQVVDTAAFGWQDSPLYIYAAPYSGSKNSPGFFMLDPHQHPSALIQTGGAFQLNNVPPGNYVLVVGPDPEQARTVVDAQQQTRIFQTAAGQVLDTGRLTLAP